MSRGWTIALLLTLTLCAAGCNRAPQVSSNNLRMIAALRTALSARNEEWLAQNEQAVEERRKAGEMSDAEYAEFQRIIAQARGGDWPGAEEQAVRFQKAQKPKTDLLEQLPESAREQ